MSVIISKDMRLPLFGEDANAARIGHLSFGLRPEVAVTATSQAAGFSAAGVLNALTYERWVPLTLPASITIDLGDGFADKADYIGIAAHTLGSNRATVSVLYSTDGITYTELQQFGPGNNAPIMLLFAAVSARFWRFSILSADAIPYVGVVYIGRALVMQRNIYAGVAPPSLNRQTRVITNTSDTGQTLGRTIVRAGIAQSFSWRHLTRPWVDANIPSFLIDAELRGFFVAWRPSSHPDDVIYGEIDGNPTLTNMGIRNYMEMSFSMRGVANV